MLQDPAAGLPAHVLVPNSDLCLLCPADDREACFPADASAMIQDATTELPAPKRLSTLAPGDLAQARAERD